jgi:phage terminase large subunit
VSAAATKLRQWREEPITFVREVLRAEPDAWQATFLEAFPKNNRMALKACKGPGKSTVLAWIGLNFLLTRPHPKVVATSITADNLRDNLWTEFSKWQQRSELLKATFTWSAERIVANDHPETWWASARAWPKSADPAQQADALAGIHADHLLFLVDEAGGIPDAVVATAEAGLANADPARGTEAKLVLAGNPTLLSGPLYRACTRERHLWWVQEISSDPDDPNRTPRVSVQWAREQIEKYGRENPWVLINVFGQFPPGQSNALVGVEDASQATKRTVAPKDYADAPRVLGIDVARFGDDRTVFVPRQGRMVFPSKVFRGLSTTDVAHQAAMAMEKWGPDAVFVDQTGVGAGVVDRLRELGHQIIGVDNGSKALSEHPKFADRRAEMWWQMGDWLRTGGCIPDDGELVSEMTGPTYFFDPSGRVRVESKKDMKARGLASPDKADALALTFAAPVVKRPPLLPGQERNIHKAITEYDIYAEA